MVYEGMSHKNSEDLRVSKRYVLSKKEFKKFRQEISLSYPKFDISRIKSGNVEFAEVGGIEFFIIDKIPAFYRDDRLYPVLIYLLKRGFEWLPRVVVDRGATRAVGRGADLMVPGIRSVDDFEEGEVVVIIDEEASVPIAVGVAILSSEEIVERLEGERRGKAIKNVHRPGDMVWKRASIL